MTSVSVIIPAYNSASTIIRALQSVAAQTLAPLEIIVVDDASSDTTRDLVATFASSSPIPVRVLTQTTNSGPSAARNAGWDKATGEYIAFLDADDQWHPRKIELQYPVMNNQPEITMSCHGHHFSSSSTWADISAADTKANSVSFHKFLIRNRCATPTVMLKRNISERFESRKRFAEDYCYGCRSPQAMARPCGSRHNSRIVQTLATEGLVRVGNCSKWSSRKLVGL